MKAKKVSGAKQERAEIHLYMESELAAALSDQARANDRSINKEACRILRAALLGTSA